MKRLYFLLPLLIILVVFAGCGQEGAGTAGLTQEDLLLTVEGTPYRCNDNIEAVIAHLGPDYDYAEGMSCDYDGLDKTFLYGAATFYTNPLSEGDLISEIYTESERVSTSKGITVGSSRAQVMAAYGEDCEDLGDLLIYRVEGGRVALCFEIEDDRVWAIYLTNQPV